MDASTILEVSAPLKSDTNAVMDAVREGNVKSLQLAVDSLGTPIFDVTDRDGLSLLHLASIADDLPVAKFLLRHADHDHDSTSHSAKRSNSTLSSSLSSAPVGIDTGRIDTTGVARPDRGIVDDCQTISPSSATSTSSMASSEVPLDRPGINSRGSTRESNLSLNEIAYPRKIVHSNNSSSCGDEGGGPVSPWATRVSHRGHTALHWAAMKNSISVARELIKAGFDVEACSLKGGRPLHFAAASGSLEMVALLLEADANPNARTQTNSSPLSAATHRDHLEIAKLLVSYGATLDATVNETKPKESSL